MESVSMTRSAICKSSNATVTVVERVVRHRNGWFGSMSPHIAQRSLTAGLGLVWTVESEYYAYTFPKAPAVHTVSRVDI